ncbi:uncharacterized protein LOC110708892 [Chenopodium quinoa]|uniref:uncharacterized protein LOC110708892 n=1 Tax=Chenopodium quinoa TaxID=63459 RepID=UPI000B78C3EF|nr:uncharacterized protein LOC110708892 [Chenopodium quinoa]
MLISRFLRVYNPKAKRMKSLRLQVADYCFGDNYEGVDMMEVLVFFFSEFYNFPREELMTLIEEELISSRIMNCFFLLLNYLQCQKAATVAKLYFGGEHMLPLLRCIFNGEGCSFEQEIFGAWDQWLDAVKTIAFFLCKAGVTCWYIQWLLPLFIPIYYFNHYSVVVINFINNSVDYLDNRRYFLGVGRNITRTFDEHHTCYYTLVWYLRHHFSKYLVLKNHYQGELVNYISIDAIVFSHL